MAQLEHVNATLKFRGNSLLIEANAARPRHHAEDRHRALRRLCHQ